MRREYLKWFSARLQREMELLAYSGDHASTAASSIVFPTSGGKFYEFEDRGMVAAVAGKIDAGEIQFYCVDSVDTESWYNPYASGRQKIVRHMQYESYILEEVVPLLRGRNDSMRNVDPNVRAAGCSFGGYHAANLALRHPDVFTGFLAMSGAFDPSTFLCGYHDLDCYLNIPEQYIANMSDRWFLDRYRRNSYVLATGVHDQCWNQNERLAAVFRAKGIPHRLEVWGDNTGHDWPWWHRMAQTYF